MSHPFEATHAGRVPPVASSNGSAPESMEQDPSLLLIDRIQNGIDVEESSRRLVKLHEKKLISFFHRRGFSVEESRDLTQDVFSRVFKAIATFRRDSRFERWLFEIAINIFRNELRRMKAEKRDAPEIPITPPLEDGTVSGLGFEPIAEEPSALESLIARERREKLRAALQKLPAQMRTCCILRYERGLKYQEIAKIMKISIETVKAHLHQARKRLIETLGNGAGKPS
jgi:RNA polymerase sigma-70 factor (ECF subfamily)